MLDAGLSEISDNIGQIPSQLHSGPLCVTYLCMSATHSQVMGHSRLAPVSLSTHSTPTLDTTRNDYPLLRACCKSPSTIMQNNGVQHYVDSVMLGTNTMVSSILLGWGGGGGLKHQDVPEIESSQQDVFSFS